MILGEPTVGAVTELIETEGCPRCGHLPGWLDIVGPHEIVLEGCGHVINVNRWNDPRHQEGERVRALPEDLEDLD